mmetsp:Transcript_39203/g.124617  ORF Transcript_39203/g.124617 Transcript_39203/m.124617 type:complete len:212 (+) Transcript_39203:240-875(+)
METQRPARPRLRRVVNWMPRNMVRHDTPASLARDPHAPRPIMMPSPAKTTPAITDMKDAMDTGVTAALRTDGSVEKVASRGSVHSCKQATSTPRPRPRKRSRSATARAASGPPPFRAISAGTSTAAELWRAKSATPPSCQNCMEIAYAAAETPMLSMACACLVAATKAAFSARDRSCTAAPPRSKGERRLNEGTRKRLLRLISCLRKSSVA